MLLFSLHGSRAAVAKAVDLAIWSTVCFRENLQNRKKFIQEIQKIKNSIHETVFKSDMC